MLTVAVINYETPELTAGCVASVLAAAPAEPFEAIVVDNGSCEATLRQLRAIEGARLVETGRNGGFAVGVNRCMAEASSASDVVVVLNSDTEVRPGALDALAAAARADGVGMSAPVLLYPDGHVQRSAHRRFPTLRTVWATLCVPLGFARSRLDRLVRHPATLSVAEHEAGVRPRHVMGAAMAFRREAWEQVGGFDERFFMYLEETDWQERLATRGWAVELVPQARVVHLHRGGEAAAGVAPLAYLDSTRIYFGERGARSWAVQATMVSSLLVSLLVLLLYRPLTRWVPGHRAMIVASVPEARSALLHAVRGRSVVRAGAAR